MKPRLRLSNLAVLLVLLNGLAPSLWVLLTSLKSDVELAQRPITWWPEHATFTNYLRAFSEQPLLRFVGNSLGVAVLSAALCVTVSAGAAYALAKLRLPRPGLLLTLLVSAALCPPASLLVPLFEIMRGLGLLNTWLALILPNAVLSLPVCTLVLVAFFRTIPDELAEAALIDGCSHFGVFRRVVLPLSVPALSTAAILALVNSWDEFLLALTLNAGAHTRTLPVGLMLYQGEFTFPWPVISAALVVGTIPIVLLLAAAQERVVGGLTTGGVKG